MESEERIRGCLFAGSTSEGLSLDDLDPEGLEELDLCCDEVAPVLPPEVEEGKSEYKYTFVGLTEEVGSVPWSFRW